MTLLDFRKLAALAVGLAMTALSSPAAAIPFVTAESSDYLIIGTGNVNIGHASNTNNFELGANKAPVPSTSDFLTGGGGGGGPGLAGNVPDIDNVNNTVEIGGNDVGIENVFQGISGDGNVAIPHMDGRFNFQDVGVYADQGVVCNNNVDDCDDGTQNSFFNDPEHFPNTWDGVTGDKIGPGDADQTTRMDDPNLAGITGMFDFSNLQTELLNIAMTVSALPAQGATLDVSGNGGKIDSDTVITLAPGINIIDVVTGGGVDFLIQNANVVIDGPEGAFALFRVPDDATMLISQANILAGDGGIGLNSIVFYSDREDNAEHFNFNNTVINGVAFWSMGPYLTDPISQPGGEININNAQGCTQLIADKVTLNDVRFTRCAGVLVPEPGTFGLTGLGLLALSLLGTSRRFASSSAR
jgi:hypothetical protein